MLPAGSSGGLVAADPAGTFVYADSTGNAFTFAAGATSFGTGGLLRLADPQRVFGEYRPSRSSADCDLA